MMAMPLLRFKQDDGTYYSDYQDDVLGNLCFEKSIRNNDNDIDLVYSVSNSLGFIPQSDQFKNGEVASKDKSKYKVVEPNEFAYNPARINVGSIAQLKTDFKVIVSPMYVVLGCKKKLLPVYLEFFVKTPMFNNKLNVNLEGSVRNSLKYDGFEKISIALPCPEEQQKIANFFSDIDNQIEYYQQSLDNLESQKKEMLRQVFSQELRFTKDDGSNYPDWEDDKLGNFCDTFSGGTPLTTHKEYYGGNIPFIKSGEINNPVMSTTITKLGFDNSSAKMVDVGDLLYAIYGATAGECALSKVKGAINQAVLCIRTHGVNTSYLLYWLRQYKLSILKYKSGLQDNLSAKTIKALTVNYPCPEEQQKIADFFSDFDERIELERQRLQTMQNLRKGLLQQMFC